MPTYYVTPDGDNGNDGLSEAAAFADLGRASVVATTAADRVWVKTGTYTFTTATPGAGGPARFNVGVLVEGYELTPGDRGVRPVISAGAISGVNMITLAATGSNTDTTLRNLIVDGETISTPFSVASTAGTNWRLTDCWLRRAPTFNTLFIGARGGGACYRCQFSDTMIGSVDPALFVDCLFVDCSFGIFSAGGGGASSRALNCLFLRCSGAGVSTGASASSYAGAVLARCTFHACDIGIVVSWRGSQLEDCLITNATTGVSFGLAGTHVIVNRLAFYNVTTQFAGVGLAAAEISGTIELTEDPYVDSANDDFTPNAAAGGGALLANVGSRIPLQTSSSSIGAIAAPGGGGGFSGIRGGGIR
jgi:hypothetical protein